MKRLIVTLLCGLFCVALPAQTLVIVGVLCSAVVLYHYLKTARMNPAETLKNE